MTQSVRCQGGGDEGESKTGLTGQEVKGMRPATEALPGGGGRKVLGFPGKCNLETRTC